MGANFIAVSICKGLCVVNAKDVVQVPEMPLPLTLLNLYTKQSVIKMWPLENIQLKFWTKILLGFGIRCSS